MASGPAPARARRASGLSSVPPVVESTPSARGRGVRRRYSLEGPPDGPRGSWKQDLHVAVSDTLSTYALDSLSTYGSHFICVTIDRRSPRGVRVLDGDEMPCIPEDEPVAWCAQEDLWCERGCWIESVKIVRLLAPGEMAVLGLDRLGDRPRRRRSLSGALQPLDAKETLLGRGAAGVRQKRVVPFG